VPNLIPGLEGFVVPDILFIHRLDVERQMGTATDAEGQLVEQWNRIYTQVPGTCVPHEGAGEEVFGQRAMVLNFEVYMGPLPDGTLPDLHPQDRLPFGTWPGGAVRYVQVLDAADVLDAGLMVRATAVARKPG
jgi:hypothetical protein